MNVAVLGTGLLGAAMAERLLARGDAVSVWNRTPSKASALAPLGANPMECPAQTVRGAQAVHVVLRDDEAVDDVLQQCGEALRGSVVVDHTTVSPAGATRRASKLSADGVAFLHAPVFMGPAAARTGSGSMFVSGPASAYELVRDHLSGMTGTVVYLGPEPHRAATLKLVGNTMIIGINAALADAFAVAAGTGLSPDEAMVLFDTFNPCGTIARRGRAMAQGDYRASFELTMARKDVQLMLDAAAARGEVPHLLPAIAARMDALIAEGHGARDLAALAIGTIPPAAD